MAAIGIGLIGTGFMGKAHAFALRSAKLLLGDLPGVKFSALCDTPRDQAERMAEQFGFARATDDWRDLIADPDVHAVSITTPNRFHRDMAVAALEAGKHVWCEKPMALTLDEAREMTEAAERAGTTTIVGYNYIKNPAYTHAQRLVRDGAIGRVVHFRGWVDEDYQADEALPWTWRAKFSEAGLGALGDMGCHMVSVACGLMGPVESLIASMQTMHESRALPDGSGRAPVENEDIATALVRFTSGAQGSISTSRAAWGRKSRLAWEVHGTTGMITFDQERMNELHLYQNAGPKAEQGFKTILTSPHHPPYGAFCPAPGHQLGFNDQKVIEAGEFLRAIAEGRAAHPSFADAYEFEKVIHAIARAARTDARVHLEERT